MSEAIGPSGTYFAVEYRLRELAVQGRVCMACRFHGILGAVQDGTFR